METNLQLTSTRGPRPDPYCHSGREGRPRLRVMLVVADVDGVADGVADTVGTGLGATAVAPFDVNP